MNAERLALMSRGSMLVNTSRGALVDTSALADALDRRRVACAGLDVYEGEAGVFFEDMSEATDEIPGASVGGAWDFVSSRRGRTSIVTPHQAFSQRGAGNIAATTVENLREFERGMIEGEYTNNIVGH